MRELQSSSPTNFASSIVGDFLAHPLQAFSSPVHLLKKSQRVSSTTFDHLQEHFIVNQLDPHSYQLFMGLDYGVKRIGVSVGSKLLKNATPVAPLSGNAAQQWEQLAQRLVQWQPEAFVVGVPYHPDGAEHVNTDKARRFIRQLEGRFNLPVFQVDERYSTTQALSEQREHKRNSDIDSDSACIILNQFFGTLQS